MERVETWPEWLVAIVGTLLAALAIWLTIKVLKWTLWLLLIAVLAGGTAVTLWLLFN